MPLVHIATSREVGKRCKAWAERNLPQGWTLTDYPERSDVFISVMYDALVDERFINGLSSSGYKRRCYNFHPGILPQYRGSGAFSWSIINGEKECGITLHELDVDIDHGPIIEQWKFPLDSRTTAEQAFDFGMKQIGNMFQCWFERLLALDFIANPQDESKAKIYYRRDLQKVMDLTRFVRAFTFEGKDPAFYIDRNGKKVELRW